MFSLKKSRWKNWSETVLNHPTEIMYPKNEEDIMDIVTLCKKEGKKLRVIGAGHSFTPLAVTDGILISLKYLSGIDQVDDTNQRVTIWAGTTLNELGPLLHQHGYAMENLGDINSQALAGAISTGTHGTGAAFGSLSTQVTMLTIITPQGDLLNVSETENANLFQAARLSLGVLGIIIKVQIEVVKAHPLIGESYRAPMNDVLANLDTMNTNNRNFEFFWFPHTKSCQVKTLNRYHNEKVKHKGDSTFNNIILENGFLWLLSECCRMKPSLSRVVSQIISRGVPTGKKVADSFKMYATPRLVKFNEMEYSIPANQMEAALNDIHYVIEKNKFQVHFPVECRFVQADDIWLSPSYQRDSAYIAIHMYKGMEYQRYFAAVEEVFQHYQGRPHWGKLHTMTAAELDIAYPKLQDFLQIRSQLDPNEMLLNDYLSKLLDIKDTDETFLRKQLVNAR